VKITTLAQVSFKTKVPRRNYIKFYQILNLETSLNFHSKSHLNLMKFLWRKFFIFSRSSKPYFFKILEIGKVNFRSVKVWMSFNFKFKLNWPVWEIQILALWLGPACQWPTPPRTIAGAHPSAPSLPCPSGVPDTLVYCSLILYITCIKSHNLFRLRSYKVLIF
jgi:hypothetical protein